MVANSNSPKQLKAEDHMVSRSEFELLKELLQEKQKLSFEILTNSMHPLIKPGMKIELLGLGQNLEEKIKPYDIVAFWDQGKIKCHYVYHLNQFATPSGHKSLVTRGLNLNYEDFPVQYSEILGLVTNFKISNLRKILLMFLKWAGR